MKEVYLTLPWDLLDVAFTDADIMICGHEMDIDGNWYIPSKNIHAILDYNSFIWKTKSYEVMVGLLDNLRDHWVKTIGPM